MLKKSIEMVKLNKWSVLAVHPELPETEIFMEDTHYREIYLNNIRYYSLSGEVPFIIYFNSRQEMYQIFSYFLDLGYNHIKINDPCDETGNDTFRRFNKRIWFSDSYLKSLDFKDNMLFTIHSGSYCLERYGLMSLTVRVPMKYFTNFLINVDNLKQLNYRVLKLRKDCSLGQNNSKIVLI